MRQTNYAKILSIPKPKERRFAVFKVVSLTVGRKEVSEDLIRQLLSERHGLQVVEIIDISESVFETDFTGPTDFDIESNCMILVYSDESSPDIRSIFLVAVVS